MRGSFALYAIVDQLRKDMLRVVGLRRDNSKKRLKSRAHRRVQHIIEFAAFRLSKLVVNDERRIVSVFGATFG